jgi:hypothetical protein
MKQDYDIFWILSNKKRFCEDMAVTYSRVP